jgi:hypothetical protein
MNPLAFVECISQAAFCCWTQLLLAEARLRQRADTASSRSSLGTLPVRVEQLAR